MKKKRKKKTACTSNSLQGLISAPDVPDGKQKDAASFAAKLLRSGCCDAEARSFEIEVAENVVVKWDTVIWSNQMFVLVPNAPSSVGTGSKESFVSLLEVAEEDLGCVNVICCIPSSTPEMSRHLRTFMYMGFERIPPDSSLLPSESRSSGKFVFLAYEL